MGEIGSTLATHDTDSTIHFLIEKAVQFPHLTCTDLERGSLFYWAGFYEESYGLDFDKGIGYLEQSKNIRIRLLGQNNSTVADCYSLLGDIYKYSTFDFFLAEQSYEKALEIMEGQPVKNDRQLARTYYSLAATNRSQKDYVKALSFGFNTLGLVNKTGNTVFLERIYVTIANIYRDMLQFNEAKGFYKKAMALNAVNNNGNPYNETLAVEYLNLAETFAMEGTLQEAIRNFELAERYYSQAPILDHLNYVFLFQQMGLAYSRAGNSKALPAFSKALAELEKKEIKKGTLFSRCVLNTGCGPGECSSGELIHTAPAGTTISFKIEAYDSVTSDCTGIPIDDCSNDVVVLL